ncbi:MAG: hypothetical protein E7342_05225 [Clostridiales bacterium]|nr:hypothetical protein [Clostridiales bacterium]
MRKRLLILLSVLIALSTVFFAVNTTAFSAQAAELKPATLHFNDFIVDDTLPTSNTANLQVDNEAYLGGFYTVFNNSTSTASATIKKDTTDGNNYLSFINKKDSSYSALRAYTGASVPAGAKIHIKMVFRPTKDVQTQKATKWFFIRYGNTSNDIDVSASYKNKTFDGITWFIYEKDFTMKSFGDYINIYSYAKKDHGFDLKSLEISLVDDPQAPVFETTNYTYDCAGSDDLQIKVNTKGAFIEGMLWDKQDGNNPIIVTRSAYEVSSDYKYITINADYLQRLYNGSNKFILQINEVLYPFEVVIANSPVGDKLDTPNEDNNNNGVNDAEKRGCGSVIGVTSAVLATALLAGAVVVFKKKD